MTHKQLFNPINPTSIIPIITDIIAISLFIIYGITHELTLIWTGIYTAIITLFVFLRICASTHWHSNLPAQMGLARHFKTLQLPCSYIFLLSSIGLFVSPFISMIICILIFALIAHIHIILLYLYYKDIQSQPICFLSYKKALPQE